MIRALTFALASTALLSAACSEEKLSPVGDSTSTSTTGSAGTGGDGAGGTTDPGPKVREVFYRNTVGSPADNLLADGDFELSIVSSPGGQYGWLGFEENGNPVNIGAETGGLCKSGLRCGRVPGDSILFARGTAAPGEVEHRASIWLKPVSEGPDPAGNKPCELADVRALACDSFDQLERLDPAPAPTADGWCEISGPVPASRKAICLYVIVDQYDVIADAATLLPAPAQASVRPPPPELSPRERGRLAIVREHIRSRMMMGKDAVPFDPYDKMREARGD
jgi:hypothetical protein